MIPKIFSILLDYSPYEPRYREPPENFRISKRYGYSKPDTKKPKSGVGCPDCTYDYQHCTWGDSKQNKYWGKRCEEIIKKKKCPRGCTIYKTPSELKSTIEFKERELLTIQKELEKLKEGVKK